MRQGLLVLTVGLVLGAVAGVAHAWYPSGIQVEFSTATWCQYCPNAAAGLEANQGWFDRTEFNVIRYYATSGGLGNPDSDARNTYYNVGGYPTLTFMGTTQVVGAGEASSDGLAYRAIIENLLGKPCHYKITINEVIFNEDAGNINLDIEVMEDVPDVSQMVLRLALLEDQVRYGVERHDDVLRDLLPEVAVTIDEIAETQNVDLPFVVDAAWEISELQIVAFVQNDADKEVMASASTHPIPEYAMRFYTLGDKAAVSPVTYTHHFDWFRVYNFGTQTDNFSINLELEGTAQGFAAVCDEQICYGPTYSETLAPGEYFDLYVDITPFESGYIHALLKITQDGLPDRERVVKYQLFTDDVEILAVDDDGLEPFEDYVTAALDGLGLDYGLLDRNFAEPTGTFLNNFTTVIWLTGLASPTLDAGDRAALGTFLDNGGHLFASGQDIGYDLHDQGGAAYQWYRTYLHANFVNDDTDDYTLDGVAGDPISQGFNLVIQGGDGANNQAYPSDIDPADGYASVIWTYDAQRNAALRADNGTHRVVYFAFGYEAIDNAMDRKLVMHKVLRWLKTGALTVDVDDRPARFRADLQAFPNPVQDNANVRFTLPTTGAATLNVFSPDGRVIRTLARGELEAGLHEVSWDRTGDHGQRIPAGIYYYRLETDDVSLVRKAVLIR